VVDATTAELFVVSPYFIPGESGVQWFRALRERGLKVTVLTNSLAASDVAAVHAGYRHYRAALLAAGVELWEVKPTARVVARPPAQERRAAGAGLSGSSRASLHAKTFAFDQRVLFVGSLNLDPRSIVLNTEIGMLFDNPRLASALVAGLKRRLPEVAYRVQLKAGSDEIEWLDREGGTEMRYDQEPEASAWRRFSSWFLSWLPIESQL
jgi:putative cardiolipin synthase